MADLILVRGISGSGKSTFAALIAPECNVAADDYFIGADGAYNFDASKLPEAHRWCLGMVSSAMDARTAVIAVANTFTQEWEMAPYIQAAEAYGYTVHIVIKEGNFDDVHNVPREAKVAQAKRFQFVDKRLANWRRS